MWLSAEVLSGACAKISRLAVLSMAALPMFALADSSGAAESPDTKAMDELLDQVAKPSEAQPGTGSSGEKQAPQSGAASPPTRSVPAPAPEPLPNPVAKESVPLPAPSADSGGQETAGKRQIEEIVVTAQKREQASQTVPISMSVMSEAFLKEQGVTDIGDALMFTPNFKVQETSTAITPQCRGFSVDGTNEAFEPPCGIAIDGVAYTRAFYFSSALFDVKRLEVLRGPQGTTFGKNTTAGVVSIVTKEPTDNFTSNVDLQYWPDGWRRAEAAVGGPIISDVVDFRVAGMKEKRRGYVANTTSEIDPTAPAWGGGRDREGWRAKLRFPSVFGSDLKLAYEHADLSYVGTPAETILDGQYSAANNSSFAQFLRQYDPNADFTAYNFRNSTLASTGETKMHRAQMDWGTEFGGWNLALVGALGELSTVHNGDVTNVPVHWIDSAYNEKSPFKTVELRTTSPVLDGFFGIKDLFGVNLGTSELLAGVFVQNQRMNDVNLKVNVYYAPTVGVLAAEQGVVLPTNVLSGLAEQIFGSEPGEYGLVRYTQGTTTKALFAQFTWHLTERWTADFGMRYSGEAKEAHWDTSYSTPAPLLNPTGSRTFVADRSRKEYNFQPKVSLAYSPSDDLNFFAHWAKGFKSGGFNEYTIAGNPEAPNPTRPDLAPGSLQYGPEKGQEWGVDAKMYLLDRQMRLNISAFRLTVDDFQVLATVLGTQPLNPVSTFALPNGYDEVLNAAKARAQGLETDLTYLPNDWLTVVSSVGLDDTKFLKFKDATCPWDVKGDPNTSRCDASGKAFAFAPLWNSTLTLQTRFPLGGVWSALDGVDLLGGTTVTYSGRYYQNTTYDSRFRQGSYLQYRASVGLSNAAQGWTIRVTGLNLTDKYIYNQMQTDGTAKIGVPLPGRMFYSQLTWNY